MKTTGAKQIVEVLANVYGVGPLWADTCTALWAAARCKDPEAQIKALNRMRAKHGKPLVYVPYGYTFPAAA